MTGRMTNRHDDGIQWTADYTWIGTQPLRGRPIAGAGPFWGWTRPHLWLPVTLTAGAWFSETMTLEGRAVIGEFRAFLLRTNALALAIGVIIGTALGTVVSSLVNDVIMPPIGMVLGGVDFSKFKVVLKAAVGGDPATEVAIRYGAFINAIIAFVVIAFVVWQLSKMFIKEAPAAEVKTCPFCKEPNAPDATKCRACASQI